jgi:hypothetical protein
MSLVPTPQHKEYTPMNQHNRLDLASQAFPVGIATFNLVLIALSLTRWFGGDASHPGAVDHLFGAIRFGGFRVDFVWMILSNLVALVALPFLFVLAHRNQKFKLSAYLCLAELIGFLVYLIHTFTSGVLDFG